jgi:DNA-binding NarL/FixJ family response regulator
LDQASSPTARVVLAAQDPLVRRALRAALEADDFEVVGDTADGPEAVQLVIDNDADVALVDLVLQGAEGLDVVEQIARGATGASVIVMSGSEDEGVAVLALRAGAKGYLSKDIEIDALPRAIKGVLAGEAAISRRLTALVVEELRRAPQGGRGMRPIVSELTEREWQVLDLLTTGASTTEIAIDLVLSPETVLTHVKNILKKLGVHSRRDAVELAARMRFPDEDGEASA